MSEFGQIFYGRARDGYGILGASSLGHPFVGFVAALCRAVGSPDRPSDIRPFLISKREGDSVVMVRGCRGDADPTGRSTLFFHALVASADELSAANLDAFVLAEKGVFLSSLPTSIDNVDISASTSRLDCTPSDELRYPAFVSSDCPLDVEVRRMLGGETLTRNWATYSYRPLDGFDLCVHSSYASSPISGNRYVLENGRFVAVDRSCATPPSPQRQFREKEPKTMLKASLIANVLLVALCVATFAFRSGDGDNRQPTQSQFPSQVDKPDKQESELSPEMTKEDAFEKWGKEWEDEFRRRLCLAFEKRIGGRQRIADFSVAMLKIDPYYMDYKTQKANPPTPQALDTYATLEAYISFVETEIINTHIKENL